jgi:DNA-binding response OmpR family regulator
MPRILIVEDDDELAGFLSEKLQERGYEIVTAPDGVQALKTLETQSFDLVLTDIVLPEKEGVQTIREIKQINPNLPIVAMSGGGIGSSNLYLDLARFAGASRTIPKPFTIGELLAVIEDVLGAA